MELYYQDQSGCWGPREWYALYRYLDRMLSSTRGTRDEELDSLDPERMSLETKYLIFHLLVLQRNLEAVATKHPNLQQILIHQRDGLLELPHPPLILQDPPKHAFLYFKRHDIWL